MILAESEVQQVIKQVKTAFPNLTDWEYNNEDNEDYYGFAVWGQFVLNPEELMHQTFFVTIDIYQDKWQGSLTTGQHSYFWSSTDEDDARLLNTKPCESLEEAIAQLKAEILRLFQAFSVV
jgi:hypothetical protein